MIDDALGDRLAAGRRVLAPLTEVRILVPQPTQTLKILINLSYEALSQECLPTYIHAVIR